MPAVQTDYTERHGVAQLGMIADTRFKDVRSFTYVGIADIGFGIALTREPVSGDDTVNLGGAGNFAGIVVSTQVQDPLIATDGFGTGETIGLLDKGSIWVAPTVTVAPGDPVTFDPATGELSNTGGTAIADAEFETSANAGELARIRMK